MFLYNTKSEKIGKLAGVAERWQRGRTILEFYRRHRRTGSNGASQPVDGLKGGEARETSGRATHMLGAVGKGETVWKESRAGENNMRG